MRRFREKTVDTLLLYGMTLAIHLCISLQMQMLHMSHDEMGVLGIAAYLTGEDWSSCISKFGYYGYGGAVLYVPAFLITKGAFLRYRLVTTINSMLMALIPVFAYHISRTYCSIQRKTAIMTALAVGFYPGYTLFSKWAWNETMLCILPWGMLWVLLRLFHVEHKGQRIFLSVLLSFLLMYSYAVHGRSLGLIAAVMLLLAALCIRKRKLILEPFSFSAVSVVLYLCDRALKHYFLSHLWLVSDDSQINNTLGSMGEKIKQYITPEGVAGMLKIAVSQFAAAFCISYGMLAAGIVLTGLLLYRSVRSRQQEQSNLLLIGCFSLLLFLAAFAVSVLFLGVEGSAEQTRGDYYVYTRYFSNTVGVLLFTVFMLLENMKVTKKQLFSILIVYGIFTFPLAGYAGIVNAQHDSSNATILNLLAYLGKNPMNYMLHFDFRLLLCCISAVFLTALILVFFRKHQILYLFLCAVFLHSYFLTAYRVILPNSRIDFGYVLPTINAVSRVENLAEHFPVVYYYNVGQAKPWSSSAMQFSLPEYQLFSFHFIVNEKTTPETILHFLSENSLIVSSEDIHLEKYSDSIHRLTYDAINTGTEYIWVYGEEELAYILSNSPIKEVIS